MPPNLNGIGHSVLSVASCGEEQGKSAPGPAYAASVFKWAFPKKRPSSADRGLRFPYEGDGLYQLGPSRAFSVRQAATLAGAVDSRYPIQGRVS